MHSPSFLLAILFIAAPAFAQEEHKMGMASDLASKKLGVETERTLQHTLEQADLAKAIGRDVVCLCGTCPKRTITDCDCGWAHQNQNAILNAVVQGRGRDEIVSVYREAYGQKVLAMLPAEGVNNLAWALPYAGAILLLAFVVFMGRRYLGRGGAEGPAPASGPAPDRQDAAARAELARELEDMD
jgi:cytochrome c-type biogenesis protein CcmH/NrfF